MTAASAIVAELQRSGAPVLAGLPGGSSSWELAEAAHQAGLRFVLTSTENGAAILASAQSEITGRAAACLAALGPGVTSVANGIAHAALDRCPLVVLTDAAATDAGSHFEHQALDQPAVLRPFVKGTFTLTSESARASTAAAARLAQAPRPGPVHVEVSAQTARAVVGPQLEAGISAASPATPGPTPLPTALVETLSSARRPLVLVGLGAGQDADAAAVRRFCRTRGIPALVTYKAKGVVPDGDPGFGGILTNGAIEQPLLDEADLYLGIGLDPVELLPRPWPYRAPLVYLGRWPIPAEHLRPVHQIIADIPAALEVVDEHLIRAAPWAAPSVQRLRRARAALWDGWSGFGPAEIVRACAGACPQARVTVDAGAHMFAATELWPASYPRQCLISNGLSTMGFALPAAIGAALVEPGRHVLAFTGDGGLLIPLGELVTAVRERLKIVCVVFDDRSLSLIRIKQDFRSLGADALAVGAVDWTRLAESFGVAAHRCDDAGSLQRALDSALAHDGPSLLDCRIDASGYSQVLRAIRG